MREPDYDDRRHDEARARDPGGNVTGVAVLHGAGLHSRMRVPGRLGQP